MMMPRHTKNISYESYMMTRPVMKRYSNAFDPLTNAEEKQPSSAVLAAGANESTGGNRA